MKLTCSPVQRLSGLPTSLGQNVAASAEYDRSRETVCLKKAGFDKQLANMPKGLDTAVNQHFDPEGIEIFGGEAQKLTLARALHKDVPFIVLDEPTAVLDPVSELRYTVSSTRFPRGKLRFTLVIVWLPVAFAMRLLFFTMVKFFSMVPIQICWRMKRANTMSYGMPGHSIMLRMDKQHK